MQCKTYLYVYTLSHVILCLLQGRMEPFSQPGPIFRGEMDRDARAQVSTLDSISKVFDVFSGPLPAAHHV